MEKPIALIYCPSGADVDMMANVVSLYKSLGYRVVYSTKYIPCNLVVIIRVYDDVILSDEFARHPVHIFNYVGNRIDNFFEINKSKLQNCLSIAIHETLHPEGLSWQPETFTAMPPVASELWAKNTIHREIYNFVHIGHLKPFVLERNDVYANNFLDSLIRLDVSVWGKNWSAIPSIRYMGVTEVSRVSRLYSQSKYALGLMYPFQRKITFSDRFWHAPLCGCTILSEPSVYENIPGILYCDLSADTILNSIESNRETKAQIQEASITFWNDNMNLLRIRVAEHLSSFSMENTQKTTKYYYILKADNQLRGMYREIRGTFKNCGATIKNQMNNYK